MKVQEEIKVYTFNFCIFPYSDENNGKAEFDSKVVV